MIPGCRNVFLREKKYHNESGTARLVWGKGAEGKKFANSLGTARGGQATSSRIDPGVGKLLGEANMRLRRKMGVRVRAIIIELLRRKRRRLNGSLIWESGGREKNLNAARPEGIGQRKKDSSSKGGDRILCKKDGRRRSTRAAGGGLD